MAATQVAPSPSTYTSYVRVVQQKHVSLSVDVGDVVVRRGSVGSESHVHRQATIWHANQMLFARFAREVHLVSMPACGAGGVRSTRIVVRYFLSERGPFGPPFGQKVSDDDPRLTSTASLEKWFDWTKGPYGPFDQSNTLLWNIMYS